MRKPDAFERRHMGRVAEIGCILCAHLGTPETPSHVHHLREGQGMGERASHWLTIPLCPFHHTGAGGVHGLGVREFERRYKVSELDLLAMTIRALTCK